MNLLKCLQYSSYRFHYRISVILQDLFGQGPPRPEFALATESAQSFINAEREQSPWHVDPTHEGILRKSVPKKRVSWERRQLKKMGYDKIRKLATPKKGIISCIDCGHWHEAHTVCGNCYSKVKAETEKMKRSMGLDRFNYYHPDKEVVYLYEDDERDAQRFGDKVVVEVNDQRPKWWTKSMLSKSHTES